MDNKASFKFRVLLILHIVVGIILTLLTFEVLAFIKGTAQDELFGWLALSSLGVGSSVSLMGLLIFVLGADILWAIFFILWILKKKMHLKGPDNTLRLP